MKGAVGAWTENKRTVGTKSARGSGWRMIHVRVNDGRRLLVPEVIHSVGHVLSESPIKGGNVLSELNAEAIIS